jgi:hypothetical protein
MQIHVLIPVSNPNTDPDPPEHVYHYTTGLKLKQIINSGVFAVGGGGGGRVRRVVRAD